MICNLIKWFTLFEVHYANMKLKKKSLTLSKGINWSFIYSFQTFFWNQNLQILFIVNAMVSKRCFCSLIKPIFYSIRKVLTFDTGLVLTWSTECLIVTCKFNLEMVLLNIRQSFSEDFTKQMVRIFSSSTDIMSRSRSSVAREPYKSVLLLMAERGIKKVYW